MLPDEEREAAVVGLKRGLASAVVSLALLWVLLDFLLERYYPERYEIYGRGSIWSLISGRTDFPRYASDSSWTWLLTNGAWRTLLTAVVATVVAVVLTVLLARLRDRSAGAGGVAIYAVGYLLGAVSVVAATGLLDDVWYYFELGLGPRPPQSYAVVVPGLLVGLLLAGFGARVLARHDSLDAVRSDPSAVLVDGWLAVLWLVPALLAVEFYLVFEGIGYQHYMWPGLEGLFATITLLSLPALLLVVVREIGWSVALARTGDEPAAVQSPDGGVPTDAPTALGPVSDAEGSWRLWPALRASRRATVGFAAMALLAAGSCVVAYYVRQDHPEFVSSATASWGFSVLAAEVFVVALVAAAVATVVGTLLATLFDGVPGRHWIGALLVDPLAIVLQFPTFYYVAWYVSHSVETPSLSWVGYGPVAVGTVAGLVIVPLVSRVARLGRSRGWSPWRVAVRSAGIACCGAAVVSIWMSYFLLKSREILGPLLSSGSLRFAKFSAVALVLTSGLFLLGDGLRAVASDTES